MTTYGDDTIALLNEHPELADDPKAVAKHLGCAPKTAERYITAWEATKHIKWALPAVVECKPCSQCNRQPECHALNELELPMLCERVTTDDVVLAELHGLRV